MPRQIPRSLLSIQMSRRALMHVERLGLSRTYLADLYHVFVTASWSKLFLTLGLLFVVSNVAFAGAYLLGGDCIRGARPGSFLDAFFFSVQTMATIGYGHMTPATLWADVLVTMQAFVGLVGTAVSTGLIFAKFAVPTARIVFSDVAVVCPQDGVESLVFRMANERGNLLVAPSLSAVVELDERSAEGRQVRRYHELKLARGTMPIFAFTWTATHPIDAESPLAGMDAASLERADARIYVALTAIEEDLVHTIHARHTWRPEDLRWGERFVEIVTRARGDRVRVDYTRFHETVPYEGCSPSLR